MEATVAYLVVAVGCLIVTAGIVVAVIAMRQASRSASRASGSADRASRSGGRTGPATRPGPVDPFRSVDDDADALRGDPRQLRPGDIVEIRALSYGVRGSLRFTEGAWNWTEHLLDDAQGGKRWLSVEEDPDLELVLWTAVPGATVTPGPATLDFDGRRYVSDESGRARYTATGTTGLDPTGSVRYHDYVSADGAKLSFESYGDSGGWEVARGEPLHRAEVLIYPQAAPGQER